MHGLSPDRGGGFGTSRVAAELRLSVKTIETHRQLIKQKLGLTNGAELTRRAAEWTLEAVRSRSGLHGMSHYRMRASG